MNLVSSNRQRDWKGNRGQIASLNGGWLLLQDKGAAVFLVLYSKLLFFSWTLGCFLYETAFSFLSFLFFFCD